MPHKDVHVVCRNCRSEINETIWYKTDEEVVLETSREISKFYGKVWFGVFIFGITILLFIWSLVLMLKSFEMEKLDKILADPNVQYEDTWYNRESSDPAMKTDTIRVIKPAKGGAVAMPGIEALQKDLDQAKKNASEDRRRIQELLQDTDQLIKSYKELEKLTQEKKVEVDKVPKEKQYGKEHERD